MEEWQLSVWWSSQQKNAAVMKGQVSDATEKSVIS